MSTIVFGAGIGLGATVGSGARVGSGAAGAAQAPRTRARAVISGNTAKRFIFLYLQRARYAGRKMSTG
jgi:hypothetical protein